MSTFGPLLASVERRKDVRKCTTCDGRGALGNRYHWADCPSGCERDHADTCVSCMGSGKAGRRPDLTERVKVKVMDITSGRPPEIRVFDDGEPYNLDPPGPHP